jgi:hypothetical protein
LTNKGDKGNIDMSKEKMTEKIADLFLDFAKLIFAGVVLGSVMLAKLPSLPLAAAGVTIMAILIVTAFTMLRVTRR